MNKEQQQIIDEAYENYENAYYKGQAFGYKKLNDNEFSPDLKILKEEFINKCKTDNEFSENWGLKIEERELTTVRERKKYDRYFDDLIGEYPDHHETLDKRGVPRKIIKLTYKGETIESYE